MKKFKAILDLRTGKTRYAELSDKLREYEFSKPNGMNGVKIPMLGIGAALASLIQPQRDVDERQKVFDLWQEAECAFFDCTADEHSELLKKVAIAEAAGFPDMYAAIKAAIISGHL